MRASGPSLRRNLLLWLLWPLLLIAPAAAALQYGLILRPALQVFDGVIGDTVISIANFVRMTPAGVEFAMSAQTERSIRTAQTETLFYAVSGPQGELIAGDPPLAEPPLRLAADEWRFYDAEIFGQEVRVGARGVRCGDALCQVRVAETRGARDQLRNQMLVAIAASLLLFAAATAVAVLVATARGLRPLRRLGQQMGARSLDDLRPVQADDVPAEVRPIVDEVNHLLERVHAGSAAQQAFLADAAHQLRTPLATLRTEAELALLQPHPGEIDATLVRIDAAAARAARLASQLLTLARSDATARAAIAPEPLDLKVLAAAMADEWVPRAVEAGVDLGFDLEAAPLVGLPFLLRELLANLLHNAMSYAGRGAQVTVRTYLAGTAPVLEVEDDGPGIAEVDRPRLLERFQRGDPGAGSGSGLGLAIVADIAAAHGARLRLEGGAAGRGLRVRVEFAPAAPATAA
ncbi:MAG: sensor histidine kinase N-terminal domain-containing protein [Burkholderiales bacterium]|nr:sensor histidine kinase N-terminal domain-containing protein [Burkholderiales bacterium]